MKKYQPQQFESKWTEQWEQEKTYLAADPSTKKGKKYVLDMFPYPSGAGLHVGHPRGYTATDILSRFYRMNSFAVLHPMGWDAFGLPAENAAIKAKKNPIDMVPLNIANFKRQMQMLGFSYDWTKEFSTTDPAYYKWTQWLFIQFYKMGLLYKKNTPINFCPFCKTGLAEEEVLADGTHERCGNSITKKDLPQWIFRITTYADRLLEDLKLLQWPPGILEMQKNWIGKKEGINITYSIKDTDENVVCFTTRPDTNFGATFIVIAPEHDLAKKIISGEIKHTVESEKRVQEVKEYVERSQSKTEIERMTEGRKKTGAFTGLYAINNLNGKELPIWISDFVLAGFGTGAVVGVPAHDLRDFEFAQEMRLDIIRVVVGKDGDVSEITKPEQVQEEEGTMMNSEFLDGMNIHNASKKIMDYLEEKKWGQRIITYHLRDWIFSRQRYWGEPIPMVHCNACEEKKISYWNTETTENSKFKEDGKFKHLISDIKDNMYGWFPLEENTLPLELPYVQSYEPTDTGESPLARIETFVKTTCPHCGGTAQRETDTMPNWAGSCWYFLRFPDPNNEQEAWDAKKLNTWMPVDWYVGGAEHAVLHLLYSRFWMKALQDLGLVDHPEPFTRLRNVGMILAEDNRKMSKSWGNVINPDDVVREYGADTVRTYEMFMAPFSQEIPWSKNALQGVYRFLGRIWTIYHREDAYGDNIQEDKQLISKLNKTIQKVSRDIEDIKFNTAVAAMMEFLNEWEGRVNRGEAGLSTENAKKLIQLLAPWAPFMTEEIWRTVLNQKESIHLSTWPNVDESTMVEEDVEIPVQVNGKVRSVVTISKLTISQEIVLAAALQDDKVKKYIEGKEYRVIYIPGRALNLIIK